MSAASGGLSREALRGMMRAIASATRAHVAQEIEKAVAPLHAEIQGLKSRPSGVRWAGPYRPGESYRAGDLVSRHGVWIATENTTAAPGSAPHFWKLVLKGHR